MENERKVPVIDREAAVGTPENPDVFYNGILEKHGLSYTTNDYFFIVGAIPENTTWILHLSLVYPELPGFLEKIVPILQVFGVAYRFPKSKRLAHQLMSGKLGYQQFAKMFCIFPTSEDQAAKIASELIEITHGYTGPILPNAAPLGNLVYAQYIGKVEFSKDLWPFAQKMPRPPSVQKVLKGKYKIIKTIKPDIKGDVFQGRYFKHLFKLPKCVIKQGRRYMWTDEGKRDIGDRLRWQHRLQQELIKIVDVPRALDLFTDNDDTYLVMEYIEGRSLELVVKDIYKDRTWPHLPTEDKIKILDYLLRLIEIVQKLHTNGYVHRDLTPVNFIIDKKDRIVLIDMELAYHIPSEFPQPPFGNGTLGFMSPEQKALVPPMFSQDVYGLGGLMVTFFTNQAPIQLNEETGISSLEQLNELIGNASLAESITSCYQVEPHRRPTVQRIKTEILSIKKDLLSN